MYKIEKKKSKCVCVAQAREGAEEETAALSDRPGLIGIIAG